jgi:transposase
MAAITLTTEERSALQQLAQTTRDTRVLKRAQALLWLVGGESVTSVAQRLVVSRQTVYSWIAVYHQRADEPLLKRLADRPRSRPGQGRVWKAARELVQAVLDKPPRDYSYDVPLWTTPLLQDYLHTQGLTISTRYIRRLLHALGYRAKRPRYRLVRRSPTWRQAKGGSNAA